MSLPDSLLLADLLCARLCHDLAGPVGAAAAGAELLEDMGDAADPETIGLVAASAAGAAARLKFFRAALGPSSAQFQASGALQALCDGYLRTVVSTAAPRIPLSWQVAAAELDGVQARLVLNIVLLARDCLPRGGAIDVWVDGASAGIAVTATGEPALLGDEAKAVLQQDLPASGPRGGQALLSRRLSESLGWTLCVEAMPRGLRFHCGAEGDGQSRKTA